MRCAYPNLSAFVDVNAPVIGAERNGGNMPTALDLADNAFDRLDRDLADQPLARADLYRSLAGMYNYAGDSRRSLLAAERSLALLLKYDPQSERIPKTLLR